MNLEYLTTYLHLVKLGNFSEVARQLSISQPAVSFQIQKLERDLGVRLVDRGQKSITLTDAGKRLLVFARSVTEEQERLLSDLDRLRSEVTGDLVIAASTIPGEMLLPVLAGEFKVQHPAVGVRVEVLDSGTVIGRVRAGDNEVGFCGSLPEGSDLECFKVGEDEIVLIVFPEHPFARRSSVSLLELEGEPMVMREPMSGTQQSLKSLLAEAGMDTDRWSAALVLGSTQAVVTAVEERVGIAFVSSLAIKKSLALGLVRQVPVEGTKLTRSFYCIYRQERVVSRLVSEFIAFVRARTSAT
ncbi:MAG: LysR family transcriptional regulator [Chloroflexi bacterium]|nr:LysR family transcriptional regulator [Chloroflexota bacterium]